MTQILDRLAELHRDELAAADDAAKLQREREAAAQAADKELATKRAKLWALIGDDLQDSKTAQEAAMILAAAFSRKLERITEMARLAADIGVKPVPFCLSRPELEKRLACRLSAIMHATLPVNNKRQLGSVMFHPGVEKADTNWRDADATAYAKQLNFGKE